MKHILKVSRHLKSPSEALNSKPIWISDALLCETFDRFSRGSRRHGSHVPGPLEARKRAAKRKNTSIAYNGASRAPVDAVGLFGPGSQEAWWTQPQAGQNAASDQRYGEPQSIEFMKSRNERNTASATIMSWFGNPLALPIPQIKLEGRAKTIEDNLLSGVKLKARKVSFQGELLRAQSLADVRLLVQKQELESSQALVFRTLALQHILESKWSLEDIKEFVLDPALNPQGSRPFRVMANALKSEWLDQTTRAGLFDVICQCVSLGIASPEEVKHTIRSIPRFKMLRETALVLIGEEPTIHEHYRKILSAIRESKIISIEDLGCDFMISLTKDISKRALTPASSRLLWDLRRYSGQSQKDLAGSILFRLFRYRVGKEDTAAVQETEVCRFLAILPTHVLPHALVKATYSVVIWSNEEITGSEHLPILGWQDLLASLGENKVLSIYSWTAEWKACLSEPSPENERAQRVVIASWVAVSISKSVRQAEMHLRKLKLGEVFKQLYSDPSRCGTRDVLARFLETLQTLPLPNKNLLLQRLRFVTDDYLVVHKENFIHRLIEKTLLHRFAILQDDRDYDRFRNHFNDALVELAESVNKDLPLFLRVSRYFIARDELAFRVIVRIIKHNHALHHALSQSWPAGNAQYRGNVGGLNRSSAEEEYYPIENHQGSSSVGHGMDGLMALTSKPIQASQPRAQLDPRQVLELMNHLAISFAISPAIQPRKALRKVYWCFEILHRYGAPIESPITRALWHAAVTRQGKTGTGTTILKWVVKQIRITEGDNVANMLLRSAGFRQKMEQQLADLNLNEEMPLDEAEVNMVGALQKLEGNDHETSMHSRERMLALRQLKPQNGQKDCNE